MRNATECRAISHESYTRLESVQSGSNRSFGFVFASFFGIVGLLPLLTGSASKPWALIVAGIFLLVAIVHPRVLAPLNRLWFRFGLLLHKIVSPIMLAIMFFLVITPIGLLMRALGKDPLRLRLDKKATSYWIERTPPGPSPDTLGDQF